MGKITQDVIASFRNNTFGQQVRAAVAGLPPLYLSGFEPSITDGVLTIGAGEASINGNRVSTGATVIDNTDWTCLRLGSANYYVYLRPEGTFFVDNLVPVSNETTRVLAHRYLSGRYIMHLELDSTRAIIIAAKALPSELSAGDLSNAVARDQIAEQLGYTDYATMITAVTSNGSIITSGGYLRATLIEARSIVAGMIAANTITAGEIATTTLQALFAAISELAAGYDGTGSYADPDEGDYSLMIDEARMYLQRYLNGGWSDVNKLTFGLLVGSVLMAFIGCAGICHPDTDPPAEPIPSGNFHLLTFEDDYTDQNGLEPDVETDVARSAAWSKFGAYSLFATSGYQGVLEYDDVIALDAPFGACSWISMSGTPSGSFTPSAIAQYITVSSPFEAIAVLCGYDHTNQRVIAQFIEYANGSSIQVVTAAVSVSFATFSSQDRFLGFIVDPDARTISLVYDGQVETETYAALSLSGASVTNLFSIRSAQAYYGVDLYQDDVLFAYDDDCDIDLFVRHYLSGLGWNGNLLYNDIIIVPASGGRVVTVNDDGGIEVLYRDQAIANTVRVSGEYLLTEDNELDYSGSLSDGMSGTTITITELPANTNAILVDYSFTDTGTYPGAIVKQSSGATKEYRLRQHFADAGDNISNGTAWLPTAGNTIYVDSCNADGGITFDIIAYKVGE